MSAELSTSQGDRIKTALESLKDFGTESVVIFRPDGLQIIGQDHAGVVDIRFVLPAAKIAETGGTYRYDCPDPEIQLGIRTKLVANALKRFSPGDRVIIGARKGAQRELYVSCRNNGKNFTSEIVTPEAAAVRAVETRDVSGMFKYNGSIIMGSNMFHAIVGDLLTADSPVIMFDCDGKTLRLSGEGLFSRSCVEIGDSTTVSSEDADAQQGSKQTATFQRSPLGDGPWIVHESYATHHMQRVAKAKNMSTRISVSLGKGLPASFEYDTPIGKLTYVVSAKVPEDIDDPKFRAPEEEQEPEALRKKRRMEDEKAMGTEENDEDYQFVA